MLMMTLGTGSRPTARVVLLGLVLVGVAVAPRLALGQVGLRGAGRARSVATVYPDSSSAADALLRNAAGHVRDGQWAEAVDLYQRVIQQFGDTVAKLPRDDPSSDPTGESDLWVDVRQYCQRRLAALPPEARALYRARVDAQAEQWYRQGEAARDRTALRRVAEQAFCSSWGDDALDLLGDLAFQDGRFDEALACYRPLVPDRPGEALGLVYPDPDVDLARVEAKKLLCRAALGDDPPTEVELTAFAAAHPGAQGPFAGRSGSLAECLAEALKSDHLPLPVQIDGRWPTFAGSSARTKVAPGPIDIGSLQWKVELEAPRPVTNRMAYLNRGMGGMIVATAPVASSSNAEASPACHPIVLNEQVVICDDERIIAYDLDQRPGDSAESIPLAWKHDHTPGGPPAAQMPQAPARYTLTASGDRIFARVGAGGGGQVPGRMVSSPLSFIVAVERSTEGKLLWSRAFNEIDLPKRRGDGMEGLAGFEGTPVADARCVYAALTVGGPMTATYVVCLDAVSGDPRWVRYVCEASPPDAANNRMALGMWNGLAPTSDLGNRLLTLDGATIYYQTNLGALAALDAETGRIRWFASYPQKSREAGTSRSEHELNPAVVHDGLVMIAPDDSDSIYAYDAATGRLVWRTPSLNSGDLVHLLGVAKGRLFATGNHVWTIDVRNGKVIRCWPDSPAGLSGFGRGLLAGDQVYWPTRTEIHILDQATGMPSPDRPPIRLQETFGIGGGNLVAGDGYLIVARPDALVVFAQNSRLIERFRQEIVRTPDDPSNYFRLAQVAEATGDADLALASLDQAIGKSRASDVIDGRPLLEVARGHRYRLLMKQAGAASAVRDWSAAAHRFEEAAVAAGSDRDRLTARLHQAEAQAEGGQPAAAVVTLQEMLTDENLRPLAMTVDGHRTVRADLAIAERLDQVLSEFGRDLYAEFERRAHDLLERGMTEKDPRLLEEVGRTYPAAAVAPEALLALGRLSEEQGHPAAAAHAYKRLLASAPSASLRARALFGLAHAYEVQQLWVPARDAYAQALARFPDERLEELGTGVSLGDLVADRLAKSPFDRMAGLASEPSLPMPLGRRWGRRWDESVRPLAAAGIPPSADAARIFLAEGNEVRPVDPRTGQSAWSVDLKGRPTWVGYLADRILAATDTRLLALGLEDGSIAWSYDLSTGADLSRKPNPFAKPSASESDEGPPPRLWDFRMVANRIFCRRGDRELLAIDGDTGLVDWSYQAPSGTIGSHAWVGPHRIVLQSREPNAILVLDTETGRRRGEFPQAEQDPEWVRDPLPIDDDRVALVVDPRTVALFDTDRGVAAWTFRESESLPPNGPPRLIGDGERLLVLHNGHDLIRLDPKSGAKLWIQPLGVENLADRPEAMALDGERFFAVSGRTLTALELSDGSTAWKRHLSGPTSGWSLVLTQRCVAAYPDPSRGELEALPLVFCHRDTGRLAQRFVFPATGSELAVRLDPQGALVATGSGLWALGQRLDQAGTLPGSERDRTP